jgi:hypothetical protein
LIVVIIVAAGSDQQRGSHGRERAQDRPSVQDLFHV